MIEFRGRTVSVTTTAEIQAWITDRKKRFPTAARVAEKKTQQETRKREADEKRKQRMEDQHKLQMQKKGDKKAIKKVKKDKIKKEPKIKDEEHKPADSLLTKEERQRKKLEKHLRKAEKLRSMLEQSDIKDDAPSGDKPVPLVMIPAALEVTLRLTWNPPRVDQSPLRSWLLIAKHLRMDAQTSLICHASTLLEMAIAGGSIVGFCIPFRKRPRRRLCSNG